MRINNIKYLSIAVLSLLIFACEKAEVTRNNQMKVVLKPIEESLSFNYFVQLPVDSLPYKNGCFSTAHPAYYYLPEWLSSIYFMPAEGSTVYVDYNFSDFESSKEVVGLNNSVPQKITSEDLQPLWGKVIADYFTPTKSVAELPTILSGKNAEAEEGKYLVAEYKYSDSEGVINPQISTLINQQFSVSVNNWATFQVDGWLNKNFYGNGSPFRMVFTRPAAYGRFGKGCDMWLANIIPINLKNATDPELSFTYGFGYYVDGVPEESFDCMYLKLTDSFDGTTPSNSEWTDVSEASGIRNAPKATGYPPTQTYRYNLSDFIGKNLHVGFNYVLPPRSNAYNSAPLYYVDDVKITDTKYYATSASSKVKYAVFLYENNKWVEQTNILTLQKDDYDSIGLTVLNYENVKTIVPGILAEKYPQSNEGDKRTVVFNTLSGVSSAEEFAFVGGKWKIIEREISRKKDKYVFSKDSGWTFVSSSFSESN